MKQKIAEVIYLEVPVSNIIKLEDVSEKHASHMRESFKRVESHFEVEIEVANVTILEKVRIQKQITQSFSGLYKEKLIHSISLKVI